MRRTIMDDLTLPRGENQVYRFLVLIMKHYHADRLLQHAGNLSWNDRYLKALKRRELQDLQKNISQSFDISKENFFRTF